jgi:hypothetical protein
MAAMLAIIRWDVAHACEGSIDRGKSTACR